jgi:hypothetical protein
MREVCFQPKAIASPTSASQRLQNTTFRDFEKLGLPPATEFLVDQVCLEGVDFPRAIKRGLIEKGIIAFHP